MIPTLTLCSLDRFRRMVDVYNYIIRVVNILTLIYVCTLRVLQDEGELGGVHFERVW